MKPNRIYQGDCLELMKGLKDNSVDMVMTSPPFKQEDVQGDYWEFYDSFFKECSRVCSKVLIIIHSATKLNYLIREYPPHRVLVWAKGFSHYSYRWNPILVYQMDDGYKVNRRIWSDCYNAQSLVGDGKKHKYQDPVELYKLVIGMFKECDIVLDPFIGSGTTALACKRLNRKFIGFEIDPESVKIANRRLAQTQLHTES